MRARSTAKWLYSNASGLIYELSDSGRWKTWHPSNTPPLRYYTRSSGQLFEVQGQTERFPQDSCIISIKPKGQYVQITSFGCYSLDVPGSNPLRTLISNENTNIQSKRIQELNFMYHIMLNNSKIFSDGSYDCDKASFAFLAQPPVLPMTQHYVVFDELLWFTGMAEGATLDLNLYRAELTGILGAVEYTVDLCRKNQIQRGRCTIYCDSKGALSAAFGHKRPTPRWTSYDLVRRIRAVIKTSPIKWRGEHVKGHQDNFKKFEHLSNTAKSNVIVDYLALEQLKVGA